MVLLTTVLILSNLEDALALSNPEHHGTELDIKRSRCGGLDNPHNIPVSSPLASAAGYNGNVLASDIYNSMWSTPPPPSSSVGAGNSSTSGSSGLSNHHNPQKWGQSHPNVKEEPKGSGGVTSQPPSLTARGALPEIMGAATNQGSPSAGGHESPHTSFPYAAAAAAAASGFPTGILC